MHDMTLLTANGRRGIGALLRVLVCFLVNIMLHSTNYSQGTSIRRRLYNAVTEAREKREEFIEFSATFSEENVQGWMTMLSVWKKDPFSSPDPFQEPAPCKSFLCAFFCCSLTEHTSYNSSGCSPRAVLRGRCRATEWFTSSA